MGVKVQYSLTEDQIRSTLSSFQISLSNDQVQKIREYIRLLIKWNQSVSLTSVVDPVEILARHFGESMFAICLISVENCRLADLGTGAGFPGLALKIASPNLRVILIESNKKKCAFLLEVVRSLELKDVEVLPSRFDETRVATDFAEIITARALGRFAETLRWAKSALARRGHVILWLGAEDTTKISAAPGWIWQPPVKIPESQRRFVLIGRPNREEILQPSR
jgi:16S rRNA (guanine527-N7)-methyltransferase